MADWTAAEPFDNIHCYAESLYRSDHRYSDEEFNLFVSEYAPAWEETFIAGKTMADCATEQRVAARL